jgi:hypothetical protein
MRTLGARGSVQGGTGTHSATMRTFVLIVGLLLAAAGLVWILQGLNVSFAPRSFMTSDRSWIAIGGVTLAAGLALAAYAWRGWHRS